MREREIELPILDFKVIEAGYLRQKVPESRSAEPGHRAGGEILVQQGWRETRQIIHKGPDARMVVALLHELLDLIVILWIQHPQLRIGAERPDDASEHIFRAKQLVEEIAAPIPAPVDMRTDF